jgi:hypothetical protein
MLFVIQCSTVSSCAASIPTVVSSEFYYSCACTCEIGGRGAPFRARLDRVFTHLNDTDWRLISMSMCGTSSIPSQSSKSSSIPLFPSDHFALLSIIQPTLLLTSNDNNTVPTDEPVLPRALSTNLPSSSSLSSSTHHNNRTRDVVQPSITTLFNRSRPRPTVAVTSLTSMP